MKATTLIFTVVAALAVSACCCQSQPAPKLHKMPKDMGIIETPVDPDQPTEPIKVIDDKNGK